jgi:LPS sulfotransferase NodH
MPSNYVICSTQRSGSTFFCECLARTRCLGMPTEWLVFLEFNTGSIGAEEAGLRDRPLAEIIRLRSEKQRMLAGSGVIGWKVMWSTMARMNSKLKREQNATIDAAFLASAFGNPKFIFFERLNKVAQSISHVVLSKTQVSHVRDQNQLEALESKKAQLNIANSDISNFLRKLLADEREWANFFRQNQIEPLRIVYEDFCSDVAAGTQDVAQFLEVDIGHPVVSDLSSPPTIRKTRSGFEEQLATRYLTGLAG